MFCSRCGSNIPDGTTFCPNCGNQTGPINPQPVNQNAPQYTEQPVYQSAPQYTDQPVNQSAPQYTDQPANREMQQPVNQNSGSSNKGLITGIIVAAVIVLAAAGVIIGVLIKDGTIGGKSSPSKKAEATETEQAPQSHDSTSDYINRRRQENENAANAAMQQASNTSSASSEAAPSGQQSDYLSFTATDQPSDGGQAESGSGESDTGVVSFEGLSTTERPTLDDFAWWDEARSTGKIPGSPQQFTDFEQMKGSWKGLFVYDPDKTMNAYGRSLINVEIKGTPDDAQFIVDWYQIIFEGEPPYDDTGTPDSSYTGKYQAGEFNLIGAGSITIGQFYNVDGGQKACGSMILPDGTITDVVLMRP